MVVFVSQPYFSSLAHLCLHLSVAKKRFFSSKFFLTGSNCHGWPTTGLCNWANLFRGQIAQICPRRSGNRAASRCKQSEKFFPTCAKKKGRTAAAKIFGEKTLFHSTTETELAAGGGTQQTRTNTKREPESGVTPENRNQLIFRD
uniref:(northern house mosquito) hypothetical protein n=1 Tax=Culex pipiens TaxID=7175 RepID=A0A8D8JW55_CULPI